MIRLLNGWLAMTALVGLVGCGSESALELQFVSGSDSAARMNAFAPDALLIDRLELQVREVKALPDDGVDGEEYKAKGTFTIDLLDSANNTIVFPAAEPVVYKKVEFKVDKPDDGLGIDGTNASLWYSGELDGTPFLFLDDKMDKITLREETGADLQDGGSATLYINLGVYAWLDGVDLTSLEADENGLVVIDGDGANKAAHQTIEDNIQAAIKLARQP